MAGHTVIKVVQKHPPKHPQSHITMASASLGKPQSEVQHESKQADQAICNFLAPPKEGCEEAWLLNNDEALASVLLGLQQIADGKLVAGPDLEADEELANSFLDAE